MRCALIAVSKEGAKLADKLNQFMEFDVYVKEKYSKFATINSFFYNKIFELISKIFNIYDAIVFISATGIAVRSIAPYIKNKLSDPAIVVVDEKGKYAISLLSGHIGGANLLSKEIAKITGGTPVITTATDVHKIIAPDLIASVLNLNPYPKSEILNINTALLNGEKIYYYIDKNLFNMNFYLYEFKRYNIDIKIIDNCNFDEDKYKVFITNNCINKKNTLCLMPQKLIAGIGCRRGAEKEKIMFALTDATKKIGKDLSFIQIIASSVVKENEQGILDAAYELKADFKFFSNEKLQEIITKYNLKESDFVKQNIGVGNVAEASALAAAECGKFALTKVKYEKVTVALVWEKSL